MVDGVERTVRSGELYRHFKGKLYQIVTVARHSETGEELVIYQALYGDFGTYARPKEMFLSLVDREKYPEVEQKYRFEKVDRDKLAENVKGDTIQMPVENVKNQERDLSMSTEEEVALGCNPYLMEFLDASTIKEKKEVLASIKNKLTDRLINDIAASLDVAVDDGDIEMRYLSLMRCLNTMSQYECNRLR